MYTINKITSNHTVDFAAEELKKYLRMMMPECDEIPIVYAPDANTGFRLGLMQDFGLDCSDAENTELDDLLYIDTDENGGIIAGDNPRSVLLAVYEYLRQNGCRWLMPGVDGEYIPMQSIKPVKYRFAPSCRYRGWGTATAQFQPSMLEIIDFSPKVGMNLAMIEFRIPLGYFNDYYSHKFNTENRPPENVTAANVLQWKRQCEAEISKRGLQFHDVGHGFVADAFGIDEDPNEAVPLNKIIPEENYKYLAMIEGERKLYNNLSVYTQFCMSNPEARKLFANSVANYAQNHSNVDFLHVWLADGHANHCECDECRKKTPSDWYMMLMNDIDDELTLRKLRTRIVFISYTDTIWAPTQETIKNPDRFTLCFAPISRTYTRTLTGTIEDLEPHGRVPFELNKSVMQHDLDEFLPYLSEWKNIWKGSIVGFEYHSWSAHAFDISGLEIAKRVNEDIKVYKQFDINGLIEDGSQRHFFPHGLVVYSYARTMFDTSVTFDELVEDYFSHAFGKDWEKFYEYLKNICHAMPYKYCCRIDAARRPNFYYAPELEARIRSVREITKQGRELIREHYLSPVRLQTVCVRLLELHADFCDMLSDAVAEKCKGNDDDAWELYEKLRITFGKLEPGLEVLYDHFHYMSTFYYSFNNKTTEDQKAADETSQMYADM